MHRRPLLELALAFLVGSLAALTGAGATPLGVALVVAGVALTALGRDPRWAARLAAVGAGAVASGALPAWEGAASPPPSLPAPGTIESVRVGASAVELDLRLDAAPADRVRVRQDARQAGLAVGARVLLLGTLRAPPRADNPGQPDLRVWASTRRLRYFGSGPVMLLEPAGPIAEGECRAREAAWRALDALGRPDGAATLAGLLLGDATAVPERARLAFDATGTTHLLSVSGVHVGGLAAVVAWVVGRLARRLGSAHADRWAAAFALPSATAFVWLSQFPLPACRSGLMAVVMIAGRLLGRSGDGLNAVGAAALLLLAAEPRVALEPSFQLSFGAVAALFGLAGGARGVWGATWAACVATAATAPIQAAHFGTLAPWSPLGNLILVPVASLVLVPLGILGLVCSGFTTGPLELAAHLTELLVEVAVGLADLFGGVWVVGAAAAIPLAAPLALLVGVRVGRPWAGLVAALLLASSPLLRPGEGPTLDVVAVGQGDALVVRDGDSTLLVDGGPDPGARALLAYLRHEGVDHLSLVVLTHAHPDHFNGLGAVVDALPVDGFVSNGHRGGGPEWTRLERALARRGVVPRGPPPTPVAVGALRVDFVQGEVPKGASENDASLVLRVDGAGASALLAGDVEAPAEARLVAQRLGPVDVLKAGHHGSKTSSTQPFLESLSPSLVLYSAGPANRYGFPHAEVTRRVAALGSRDCSTHVAGRIRVALDGSRRVESFHDTCGDERW